MPGILVASLAIATASLAVIDPAPAYDPWAWLLWGREAAELRLSTAEGPAFKPLPVAVSAVLAAAGGAAPSLWVLVARTAAIAALLLAFRLGRRLSGGSAAGGALAAVSVLVTGQFAGYAAAGVSEGMLLALALGGLEAARRGRARTAVVCAAGCALLRVETWPLLLPAVAFAWWREPALRGPAVAAVVLVPIAWFLPEWLGSGDLLRSGGRARVPNPGQPALAAVPALASLKEGLGLVPWTAWAGVLGLACAAMLRRRPAVPTRSWSGARVARGAAEHPLAPAAIGLVWMAIVAAMAQAGFSGEARYAMPGAALVGISGAVGLVAAGRALRVPHAAAAITGIAAAVLIGAHAGRLASIPAAQAHQWRLYEDLRRAVAEAGGRDRVLTCGTPYVGRLRGPLIAYALDVEKARVEPDAAPSGAGIVFRSSLRPGDARAPDAPATFAATVRIGEWEVLESCRERASDVAN